MASMQTTALRSRCTAEADGGACLAGCPRADRPLGMPTCRKAFRPLGHSHLHTYSVELEGTFGDSKRTAHSGSRSGTPFRTPCRHLGVRFMPIDPANKGVAWALQRTVRRQAGRCIKGASKRRLPRAKRGRATAVIHAVLSTHIFAGPYGLVASCSMIDPTSGRAHQTLLAAHAAQSQNRAFLWCGRIFCSRSTQRSRADTRGARLVVCSGRLLEPLDQAATHEKPNLHQEARSI